MINQGIRQLCAGGRDAVVCAGAEGFPMSREDQLEFNLLDVGCGTRPKGDVNVDFFSSGFNPQTGNQIQGEYMTPRKIKNFVIADASHLPFRDGSFNVVFSSHTIEHVENPTLMFRELCRIAKRKVIVRCPHRKGSGAVMPFHLHYFDEDWFEKASGSLGFESEQFINVYDYPISGKFKKNFPEVLQSSLPWRALRHFERAELNAKARVPFELEAWVKKKRSYAESGKVMFVVVYDSPQMYRSGFASSSYVQGENVVAYHNVHGEPIPKVFNRIVQKHLDENVWFVFCHQDFVLQEDLQAHLKEKETEAIYGPMGVRLAENKFYGRVTQTGGKPVGSKIIRDTPVQTLDERCLVAHVQVFRQGLSFDERLCFDLYGADFCMQAYAMGLDVLATPLRCQYPVEAPQSAGTSAEHFMALKLFKEKWKHFLPIRTLTTIVQ